MSGIPHWGCWLSVIFGGIIMKFTRYLQDTQTSEWEKAYINYHKVKLQLEVIQALGSRRTDTWSSFGDTDVDHVFHSSPDNEETYDGSKECSDRGATTLRVTGTAPNVSSPQTVLLPKIHRAPPPGLPFFEARGTATTSTLQTILSNLPAIHAEFFEILDAELDKIDIFYTDRAKEMHERAKTLRKQLDKLGIHRQIFYDSPSHSAAWSWARRAYNSIPSAISSLAQWIRDKGRGGRQISGRRRPNANQIGTRRSAVANGAPGTERSTASSATLNDSAKSLSERWDGFQNPPPSERKNLLEPYGYRGAKKRLRHAVVEHYRALEILNNYRSVNLTGFRKALRKYGKISKIRSVMDAYMKEKIEPSAFGSGAMVGAMLKEFEHLFAARFEHGNKKKAMSRLRAGPTSRTYHSSTFRSGWWLGLALPAISAGCTLCFQEYTRNTLQSWDIMLFVYSIFVIPIVLALLVGINISVWLHKKISYVFIFRLNLRSKLDYHEYFELPSFLLCTLAYAFWFSFAQIGSPMLWPLIWLILVLAVMFSPFRGFMWGSARWWTIRKIAKLAASGKWEVEFTDVWLGDQLCSLVYSLSNLYFVGCFYTHFSTKSLTPTLQSLINLESSLFASFSANTTIRHQIESPILDGTLNTFSPTQAPHFQQAWTKCGLAQNWQWYYLLGILPFVARVAQNLRRYWDSKLPSQLLNAGKYGMGIIYYFCYCYWRHRMSPRRGEIYILYCFMGTVNSIYSCVWDLTMDWGLCKPHAPYPLLRPELIYKSHLVSYYFALVSNVCLRFSWVTFIFVDSENYELYSFIIAMLEMLRRVQWNFFRLENKHLHNTGLHRIMHEAPLPYDFEMAPSEEVRLKKRMARLS